MEAAPIRVFKVLVTSPNQMASDLMMKRTFLFALKRNSAFKLRANKNVGFIIKSDAIWLGEVTNTLKTLIGAASIEVDASYQPAQGVPAAVTALGEVYMPLEGLIDVEEESKRLNKEIAKVEDELAKADKKLSNPNFVERAKPEIVAEHKERRADWQKKLEQLKEMLGNLAG